MGYKKLGHYLVSRRSEGRKDYCIAQTERLVIIGMNCYITLKTTSIKATVPTKLRLMA